ncbi:hypothetical protein [uncultured Parasphingorhabdus sp.]|uniref:tetratricopeptide repeat protein n=1 Tax=uncultured Parasphingorhabdus sp. TaxID=2709694 RepID=UPI0030DD2C0A
MLLISVASLAACTSSQEEAAKKSAQAQSYLGQNRIAEARIAIEKAVYLQDDVPEYQILRGRIEYAADANENAFTAFSEALSLDATNQEALQAVSQIGLQIGRWRESLEATDKLLLLNPNDPNALLVRGLHALLKRDFGNADAYAIKLLAINPANEGAIALKARAAFLEGKPEEAQHILDQHLTLYPNTTAISLTRLEVNRELRNAAEMEKQFSELRKLQPDDMSIRIDEANFRYKTGKRKEATAIVAAILANEKTSLEIIRSAVDLWREYSVSRLDRDFVSRIVQTAKPQARIAAARHFANSGNDTTATQLLEGLTGPKVDAELANIAMLTGNDARARTLLDSILAFDKTNCASLETQAQLQLNAGKVKAALLSAQRAASECPDNIKSWASAAKAYSQLGDQVNARRVFRQGIDANKQNEPLARTFAEWLIAEGKDREAIATAKRLTRLAPALTSGWRLYSEICTKTKSDCVAEAKRGLEDSATRYGIDLLPGQLAPNGLFGRFVIR